MAAYRRFAAKGVFVTPTLNGSRIIAYLDRDDHSKDEGLAYIGPKLRKTYDWRIERAAKADAAAIAPRHKPIEDLHTILPILAEAGVPIIPGPDAGLLKRINSPYYVIPDQFTRFHDHVHPAAEPPTPEPRDRHP